MTAVNTVLNAVFVPPVLIFVQQTSFVWIAPLQMATIAPVVRRAAIRLSFVRDAGNGAVNVLTHFVKAAICALNVF